MIDWDDAFDNSGYVAGSDAFPAIWAATAAAYRAKHEARGTGRFDLSYGPHQRNRYDLFLPDGAPKGLVVFVHGGYWLKFDKTTWSHLTAGSVSAGWAVAAVSYPLAPEARISEITRAVTAAIVAAATEVAGPIRLAGHSAGGHLVARQACEGVLPREVVARLVRTVSISGVHSLLPLTATKMNDKLRLTEDEAQAESPALCQPLAQSRTTFWVGAQERPEFLRQTRLIEERWAAAEADVRAVYEAGKNHFSVVEGLTEAGSALMQEVLT